jgi:AraC family transcriptional regulator
MGARVTTDYGDIGDYASTASSADLRVFDGFSVLVDRTPIGSCVSSGLKSNVFLVDCLGTQYRECRIDDAQFKGFSLPGTLCLMPAHQDVSFRWGVDRRAVTSICIEVETPLLERLVPELESEALRNGTFAATTFKPAPRLVQLARLMEMETPDDRAASPAWTEDVMRLFLAEALRIGGPGSRRLRSDRFRLDRRLRNAIDYIESNLGERLGLQEISRVAGLSPTHLSTLFRNELGTSPHAYIIDRRIGAARRRLEASEESVATVALECGFSDQAHMTRAFRQRLGQTPAAFRRRKYAF